MKLSLLSSSEYMIIIFCIIIIQFIKQKSKKLLVYDRLSVGSIEMSG